MKRSHSFIMAILLSGCTSEPPPRAASPNHVQTDSETALGIVTASQLGAHLDQFVGTMGKGPDLPYAFSGIVAVAKDGTPRLVRSYGVANLETGARVDADTRFRVGSIAKQFAAVCILQLSEKGKMRTLDPVRAYLRDYPAKSGDVVTLHHLLTHTSGIPNYIEDETLMREGDKPHTAAQVLASFKDKPLDFSPGTHWKYSNSNYFLLGLIVEKVSGQSYEAYLQEHVLHPAGMARTSMADRAGAANSAVGYESTKEEPRNLHEARLVDGSVLFSSGALQTTANDLFRWDRALAGSAILSADSQSKRLTPYKNDYGYGVFVERVAGHLVESHAGNVEGFHAEFGRIADLGLAYAVLGNGPADASSIGTALRTMMLEGKRGP